MSNLESPERALRWTHVLYAICGLIAAATIAIVVVSLTQAVAAGDIYDPETGERYEADTSDS